MQQHHIDPVDVRAPRYCMDQAAEITLPPVIAHRLRQFFFQASIVIALVSVAYLTFAKV